MKLKLSIPVGGCKQKAKCAVSREAFQLVGVRVRYCVFAMSCQVEGRVLCDAADLRASESDPPLSSSSTAPASGHSA